MGIDKVGKNAPPGDNQRNGAVRKRAQIKTKVVGETRWTKRDKTDGEFIAQTETPTKSKGVVAKA